MMITTQTENFHRVDVPQSDPAAILYSSGTTGRVKGVALTHRNYISALAGAFAASPTRSSPAVALCNAPYFHSYGFLHCLRAVACGETAVSMERFDLRTMLRAVEEFRVTHLALVPPVVVKLVNDVKVAGSYDLSSVEMVLSGGAPLATATIQRFRLLFPNVQLAQGYGMTEAAGGIARTIGVEECQKLGSIGKLAPSWQAKIVDPNNGIGLPPLNQGELWVRGPFIMKGYVDDEDSTATILDSEGWLRTGDLCYFDNEGFLFYIERLKDLIKYKGYQVPPAELERLLQSHPDVLEAAVVPYPDEEAGQIPIAFVVRRSGSKITESEIMNFVAKQVSPYKKIRRVSFINSIPKNAPGKVLRKELIKLPLSSFGSKL